MSKPMRTMTIRIEEDSYNQLNKIVSHLNKTSNAGAGVSTASIIRSIIDNYINDYWKEEDNNLINIRIDTSMESEALTMEQHEWLVLETYDLYMKYRSYLTEDSSEEDKEFVKELYKLHSKLFISYPPFIALEKFHNIDKKYQKQLNKGG